MGGWREEWENQGFRTPLNLDRTDWLRARFLTERRAVLRFTVQYEAIVDGVTYPVIRWDTAHGYVHRDTLGWDGRVVDKLPVYGKSYNRAMTEAIEDVQAHWSTYRAAFTARKPR